MYFIYLFIYLFIYFILFFFHKACLVESIYQRPRINTYYSSKWSISATPDQCWTIKRGDYSLLCVTVRFYSYYSHYSYYSYYSLFAIHDCLPLYAPFVLFPIRFSWLFAIRVFQAAQNILCKQIHNNQNLTQSVTNLIDLPLKKEKPSLILS